MVLWCQLCGIIIDVIVTYVLDVVVEVVFEFMIDNGINLINYGIILDLVMSLDQRSCSLEVFFSRNVNLFL